jgi:hypothetical protein
MFDFGPFPYDFDRSRHVVAGEAMIFHCHHYNCFLQRSIEDAEYIDSEPFLIGAAAEVAYLQLSRLFAGVTEPEARKALAADLYKSCGYGLIDLSGISEKGGVVRTPSTHYSTGWQTKFGPSKKPVAFFSAGYLGGALAAIYGHDLARVRARQTACRSMGAAEDVFELELGDSNFARFPAKKTPEVLPLEPVLQPETNVDRVGIPRAVATLPLSGDDRGLIWNFGLYLTRMYADYYNRISFEFEHAMIAQAGTAGVDVSKNLFIEAGHVCAFNTFGGIMTSPEWDGMILPQLQNREDWVHGILAVAAAFGWGGWKVKSLSPDGAVFRVYDDYESLGYQGMYGKASHAVTYLAVGAAAGVMNLVYLGDIASKPSLTDELYESLFKGKSAFKAEVTACRAEGHPFTEIQVARG